MADIELVIKIPEKTYHMINAGFYDYGDMNVIIQNGTPLPKGHGRLIDVNSVYQIVRPIEPSDAEWGMTAETAKQLIHDAFKQASTIIGADKEKEDEGCRF